VFAIAGSTAEWIPLSMQYQRVERLPVHRPNAMAEPFDWTLGRDDLDKLLTGVDTYTAHAA
jgi:hypothetical protein